MIATFIYIPWELVTNRQLKPLHIAEVLTMRQVLIARIHADSTLVLTSLLGRMLNLKGIEITIFLHHLQWFNREYALITILVNSNIYFL